MSIYDLPQGTAKQFQDIRIIFQQQLHKPAYLKVHLIIAGIAYLLLIIKPKKLSFW